MKTVLYSLCIYAVLGGFMVAFCGCAPANDAAKAKAAVYALELQACVDHATTLAQSRFCRCEVSKRYGRPCDE